ncbi:MAG: flavin reductase [Erythrobacter sp.]
MNDIKSEFLHGMSHVAATVNIVTTDGPAGRSGVTVSAMSSVSADTEKPTLLVCINDASSGVKPIIENGVFCVNILRDDQSFVSDTFAGRFKDKGEDKFNCAEWHILETGAPAITDGLVAFDCRLKKDVVIGTHHVFFGEVEKVSVGSAGSPLIYANRSYGTPFRLPSTALNQKRSGDNDPVRLSCLDSFAPYFLPAMMQTLDNDPTAPELDVIPGDQSQVLDALMVQDADLALIYDFAVPDNIQTERLVALRPYIVLPADHALARQDNIALEMLIDEPLVLMDAPVSGEYFLDVFEQLGLTPSIGMRTTSFELVRSMVANGAGYSILVTNPTPMVSYDGKPLISVPIADEIEPIHIALSNKSDKRLDASIEKVFGQIKQHFVKENASA